MPPPSFTSACTLFDAGGMWDAVRVPRRVGLAAMTILGPRCGGVVDDEMNSVVYYFVPVGTAASWEVAATRALGAGASVAIPSNRRTAGPGPYWRMCPGEKGWLTEPRAPGSAGRLYDHHPPRNAPCGAGDLCPAGPEWLGRGQGSWRRVPVVSRSADRRCRCRPRQARDRARPVCLPQGLPALHRNRRPPGAARPRRAMRAVRRRGRRMPGRTGAVPAHQNRSPRPGRRPVICDRCHRPIRPGEPYVTAVIETGSGAAPDIHLHFVCPRPTDDRPGKPSTDRTHR